VVGEVAVVGVSRAAVAAAVLLVAVALGACTGDEPDTEVTAPTFVEESPSPSASSAAPPESPEPSAEPTVAAPPLPELATQQTPEGAVAFTEWWFETLNYATATGDTAGLRAVSEDTCGTCSAFAERIESAYLGGGRIQGGAVSVRVDPPPSVEQGGAALAVFSSTAGGEVEDASGQVTLALTAEDVALVVAVLWRETRWTVGGITS
jgi:hypothetical protein